MSRPDPIQYAERLYTAIRAANFSPISFLAFGNAVKDGVDFRRMPRMAAEPFMRVVGEMLDLEEEMADDNVPDAEMVRTTSRANHREPTTHEIEPCPETEKRSCNGVGGARRSSKMGDSPFARGGKVDHQHRRLRDRA